MNWWQILLWLVAGCWNSGYVYAHFQRKYKIIADVDRAGDTIMALIAILAGPTGVVGAVFSGTFLCGDPLTWYNHGWLFPGTKDH